MNSARVYVNLLEGISQKNHHGLPPKISVSRLPQEHGVPLRRAAVRSIQGDLPSQWPKSGQSQAPSESGQGGKLGSLDLQKYDDLIWFYMIEYDWIWIIRGFQWDFLWDLGFNKMLMNDGWSLLMIEDDLQAISPSNVYIYIYNTGIKWRHDGENYTYTHIIPLWIKWKCWCAAIS